MFLGRGIGENGLATKSICGALDRHIQGKIVESGQKCSTLRDSDSDSNSDIHSDLGTYGYSTHAIPCKVIPELPASPIILGLCTKSPTQDISVKKR